MAAPASYSRTQVILHWVIAMLVIFQIFAHEGIAGVWEERMNGAVPNEATPNLHALVGIVILVLAVWRLWLRFTRGVPALPANEHPALKALASATHWLFYVLLIGMPISGAVAWFAGLPQPAVTHELAAKIMIALILLHVAAALAQHFWFRTDVLRRMTGRA
jgi:cytochrome b561